MSIWEATSGPLDGWNDCSVGGCSHLLLEIGRPHSPFGFVPWQGTGPVMDLVGFFTGQLSMNDAKVMR
jgi:hypothetical protein